MPVLASSINSSQANLARLLIYGPAKTRKTWWALRAAELGFNVILADMDYGFHVASNLSEEAQQRIYHIDMRPPVDSYRNTGAITLAHALQSPEVCFDETARCYVPVTKLDPDATYLRLRLSEATSNDVLVIDTWTALYTHIALSTRNITDPVQLNKLEWDDYAKLRLALDHFLSGMSRLNCHVIVIGHIEEYAKRKADASPKDKPNEAIEYIKHQVSSISHAHAATISKHFTDVLTFDIPAPTIGTVISTKGGAGMDNGSRRLPPSITKFDELDFSTFVSKVNIELARRNKVFSSPACVAMTGAEILAARGSSSQITVGTEKKTMLTNFTKKP